VDFLDFHSFNLSEGTFTFLIKTLQNKNLKPGQFSVTIFHQETLKLSQPIPLTQNITYPLKITQSKSFIFANDFLLFKPGTIFFSAEFSLFQMENLQVESKDKNAKKDLTIDP
jgi:hypothetical protein